VLVKTAACGWLILADTDENWRLRAKGLMPVGEAAAAGPGRAPRPVRKVKIFIRDQWWRLAAAMGQGDSTVSREMMINWVGSGLGLGGRRS
jgi:hypothetical protein